MNDFNSVDEIISELSQRWENYVTVGSAEIFVEFITTLVSANECFAHLRMPGLLRLCQGLETLALTKLSDQIPHPLSIQDIANLTRQVNTLMSAASSLHAPVKEKRTETSSVASNKNWLKPRSVWLICDTKQQNLPKVLQNQLEFFGFRTEIIDPNTDALPSNIPLAVIFNKEIFTPEYLSYISNVRKNCPASHLIYIGVDSEIKLIVELLRAGIDKIISQNEESYGVLDSILNLVQITQADKSKVLIVEDSRVAVEVINRALLPQNIETFSINNPVNLIKALDEFKPDLVLMDMHMPGFNGVEATRALRQFSAYNSIPVVYLSGESDIGMQVEALRLGGDQFLTKPFNPVLLTAIVKTKIERYREIQRSTQIDGLTGLINHSAAKSKLEQIVNNAKNTDYFSVVMLDIDHFKSINDLYGHPVGDEVIRELAWLLKGRLRGTDIIGRYGGEEFLVILPDTDLELAKSIMDRIRINYAELAHSHLGGEFYTSFSAGIAAYPTYINSKLLIEAADNALLNAKHHGRNRIETAIQK
ncbi:MAG TPA: diguanylate cyclase [Methylotenera sp.]|nr:diguanylate cyclase [Methylotenera sp.]